MVLGLDPDLLRFRLILELELVWTFVYDAEQTKHGPHRTTRVWTLSSLQLGLSLNFKNGSRTILFSESEEKKNSDFQVILKKL